MPDSDGITRLWRRKGSTANSWGENDRTSEDEDDDDRVRRSRFMSFPSQTWSQTRPINPSTFRSQRRTNGAGEREKERRRERGKKSRVEPLFSFSITRPLLFRLWSEFRFIFLPDPRRYKSLEYFMCSLSLIHPWRPYDFGGFPFFFFPFGPRAALKHRKPSININFVP